MAIETWANAAATTLASSITSGATTLTVTLATAFPAVGNFRIVVTTSNVNEIMIVTAVSGTTFTVLRGQEGTTAVAHNGGDAVTQVLTVGGLLGVGSNLCLSDSYAAIPSSSIAGRLFFPTDGWSILRDTSSSWIPWGPDNSLLTKTPSAASLTALNVTTATITDTAGGLWINAPNISNSHVEGWYKALAAGAYTWIARLGPILTTTTFSAAGLFLRDSAGGKIITFEQFVFGGGNLGIEVTQWSDANTRITNAYISGGVCQIFPWLKIADDGTNRTYSVSHNGQNWIDLFTEGRMAYLGVAPNQAGVFATANGGPVGLTVYSWNGV